MYDQNSTEHIPMAGGPLDLRLVCFYVWLFI